MTVPELSDEFADNLLDTVRRMWLAPEVRRRLDIGSIAGDAKVWAVQVIFEVDRALEVRLNDEVSGTFRVDSEESASEGHTLNAETALAVAERAVRFELDDDDRPNAAHLTVLMGDKGFFIVFDFRYNASAVAELVLGAREFLETAREAGTKGRNRAVIANLYTAVELLAKARLMLHSDPQILTSKKHEYIRSQYNLHSRHGGPEQHFAALLNKLAELRNPARYSPKSPSISLNDCVALISDCDAMMKFIVGLTPDRTRKLISSGA